MAFGGHQRLGCLRRSRLQAKFRQMSQWSVFPIRQGEGKHGNGEPQQVSQTNAVQATSLQSLLPTAAPEGIPAGVGSGRIDPLGTPCA
jgi:hypothetical protein